MQTYLGTLDKTKAVMIKAETESKPLSSCAHSSADRWTVYGRSSGKNTDKANIGMSSTADNQNIWMFH